ncbi:MAG: hypothetical protein PHO90_01780 [Candidatus Pacebacteria bacterium]|nr:hypothetical protein [Candidatus Paceibacterota bacterium]
MKEKNKNRRITMDRKRKSLIEIKAGGLFYILGLLVLMPLTIFLYRSLLLPAIILMIAGFILIIDGRDGKISAIAKRGG